MKELIVGVFAGVIAAVALFVVLIVGLGLASHDGRWSTPATATAAAIPAGDQEAFDEGYELGGDYVAEHGDLLVATTCHLEAAKESAEAEGYQRSFEDGCLAGAHDALDRK
jgi:hypothetical protein